MTFFTIARKISQTYGHGDFGEELMITRGSYGVGDFPPLFSTQEKAEYYLEHHKNDYYSGQVVSLKVIKWPMKRKKS